MSISNQRGVIIAALRLAAPFWTAHAARRAWVMAGIIGLSLYVNTRLALAMNAFSGSMTNAVVARDWPTLRPQLLLSIAVMVGGIVINMLRIYLRLWIEIDWRRAMIDRLVARWTAGARFYRLERDRLVDNADQRIGEDVFLFVDSTLKLVLMLVSAPSMVIIYGSVLWKLGGVFDLAPIGIDARLPGGLLWLTFAAVAVAAGALLLAGRRLLPINVERQRREGDLRFTLAGIRNHAEEIAFYRGTPSEQVRIGERFDHLSDIWYRLMRVTVAVTLAGQIYGAFGSGFEQLFGYHAYLAGRIDYGTLVQIGGAVLSLAMSIFTLVQYIQDGDFYIWAAAIRRLAEFDDTLSYDTLGGIEVTIDSRTAVALETRGLRLDRPDGGVLAQVPDCRFIAGERWLIVGASGVGKSTLMRALSGLWPYGAGEIVRGASARALFLPQASYIPGGSLWNALCYPGVPGSVTRTECCAALEAVRLPELIQRLDEVAPWQQQLSPGEQQRLAIARVLLQEPNIVLLDEATSALDSDNERHLYRLLIESLPGASIVSIAHRESLVTFHTHHLTIMAPAPKDAFHDC